MRLSKEKAFLLAEKLTKENPHTTAFYRFADFENYYLRRLKTDEFLYNNFSSLGGKPKERHPVSFVLQGCDYLDNWFGRGISYKIKKLSPLKGRELKLRVTTFIHRLLTQPVLLSAIQHFGRVTTAIPSQPTVQRSFLSGKSNLCVRCAA